jgi:hypothetical protein
MRSLRFPTLAHTPASAEFPQNTFSSRISRLAPEVPDNPSPPIRAIRNRSINLTLNLTL